MMVYNFVTKEYDCIEDLNTLQDLSPYVPQLSAAQNYYKVLLEIGHSPIEAMRQVLEFMTANK